MGRKRDIGRKYPSGAEKERIKTLKQEKEKETLSKIPKLDTLFKKVPKNSKNSENEASSSGNILADIAHGDSTNVVKYQNCDDSTLAQVSDSNLYSMDENTQMSTTCPKTILKEPLQLHSGHNDFCDEKAIIGEDNFIYPDYSDISNQNKDCKSDNNELESSNSSPNMWQSNQAYSTDIGKWPRKLSEALIDYWITRGSDECNHNNSDFSKSFVTYENDNRNRFCRK